MRTEKIIYNVVVGYMLKIIKSKKSIRKYKNEFNAIKHGDYNCFIDLIGVGIPSDIIVLKEGKFVKTENQLNMKNADFLKIMLASLSLVEFHKKCKIEFGDVIDKDLKDEDFEALANFEMILRMFVNNIYHIDNRINLETVINLVCEDMKIPEIEIAILQKGREFLNMVKGHKAKFPTYEAGLAEFCKANEILVANGITMYG